MIRNLWNQMVRRRPVVNSFQNFIFKDDSQHFSFMLNLPQVVNSFQNFIFKDDSQRGIIEQIAKLSCE